MPKSGQATVLARLPCTDQAFSFDRGFAKDLRLHLFFIIVKVLFILREWLHSRRRERIIQRLNTLRQNLHILSGLRTQETALILQVSLLGIRHLLDRVFLNRVVLFTVILGLGNLQELFRHIQRWLVIDALPRLFKDLVVFAVIWLQRFLLFLDVF